MNEDYSRARTVLSAGVVIVSREQAGCRFLLLRVYNYWDFPKGEVESGEAPLDAARREVEEETGIVDLSFPWGDVYYETPPYRSGQERKIARYYVATTPLRKVVLAVNPELGKPEHDEYCWVNLEQARELLGWRLQAVLQWAAQVSSCEEDSDSARS